MSGTIVIGNTVPSVIMRQKPQFHFERTCGKRVHSKVRVLVDGQRIPVEQRNTDRMAYLSCQYAGEEFFAHGFNTREAALNLRYLLESRSVFHGTVDCKG